MKNARYETSLTDAQWAYLKPMLTKPSKRGRPPTDRRCILNAILYVVKCGCPWRYLPTDFPPWKTVYHVFRQWTLHHEWAALNDALRTLVRRTHLARARQKLNAGADVNHERDPNRGESPLEMAVWLDSTEMVSLLLEFGADPNQQDEAFRGDHSMLGGNTSLHEAVYKGSAKMVQVLLAHGADPDIPNADGLTPMELATRRDCSHLTNLMEAHLDKKLSLNAAEVGVEQLYTVKKVAELLSVDDAFVLDLIKARKMTCLKLDDKTMRIPAGSVQRYRAKRCSDRRAWA